jgi:hypothetical protein
MLAKQIVHLRIILIRKRKYEVALICLPINNIRIVVKFLVV